MFCRKDMLPFGSHHAPLHRGSWQNRLKGILWAAGAAADRDRQDGLGPAPDTVPRRRPCQDGGRLHSPPTHPRRRLWCAEVRNSPTNLGASLLVLKQDLQYKLTVHQDGGRLQFPPPPPRRRVWCAEVHLLHLSCLTNSALSRSKVDRFALRIQHVNLRIVCQPSRPSPPLRLRRRVRFAEVQGYLANKKQPPPRTLQ